MSNNTKHGNKKRRLAVCFLCTDLFMRYFKHFLNNPTLNSFFCAYGSTCLKKTTQLRLVDISTFFQNWFQKLKKKIKFISYVFEVAMLQLDAQCKDTSFNIPFFVSSGILPQ
ncbi:unnamed protein product [Ixodes pacificus]